MTSSPKRVLVTGGTGFVGSWMCNTRPENVLFVNLDRKLYERGDWETGYYLGPHKRGTFDAIVHLAPVSPARVLAYAQKYGARVLYASSGAIYNGTDEYATNKRMWELLCHYSKVDVVVARLFSFIGPHLNRHAVHEFIEQAQQGGPIVIQGNGTAVRTYLHGEDLGRWMWKILLEGHGTYDVGGSIEYTILQVAQAVADCFPDLTPPTIKTLSLPDIPETYYVPAVARAEDLGCRETIDLKTAIERTIRE